MKQAVILAALMLATAVQAQEQVPGDEPIRAVVRVVDGDTLEVDGEMFRINGIDAPEAGQKCNKANGKTWPCGKDAVEAMAMLVEKKKKRLSARPSRRTTMAAGLALAMPMVLMLAGSWFARATHGLSCASPMSMRPTRQRPWRRASGIWQAETQTPWDFRSGRWDRAVSEVPEEAPEGCPIKGSISQNGKIYHPPWSPWYGRTKFNEAKGERWFCDEGAAVKAGWRAPYWW